MTITLTSYATAKQSHAGSASRRTIAARLLCLVLPALIPLSNAYAKLLVYEGFDYGADTQLVGQTGGIGLDKTTGWTDGPFFNSGAASGGLSGDNASLAFPPGTNLVPQGARYEASVANTNDDDFIRLFDGFSIDMNTEGEYYVSMLARKDVQENPNAIILTLGAAPIGGNAEFDGRAFDFGFASGDRFLLGEGDSDNSSNFSTVAGVVAGETYFMVAKLVTHAGTTPDEFFLKVFDSSATSIVEPTSIGDWTLTETAVNNTIIDRLRIQTGDNVNGNVDEIRLGTTWASVTLVPEPKTYSLLACAMIGLLAMARRKRKTTA